MKRFFCLFSVLLLAFSTVSARADWPFDSYFSRYTHHVQAVGKPLFYSQCFIRENGTTQEATIVFQVGQSDGLFLYSDGHSIVNLTTLQWDGKVWKIGDLLGGVYTINKMYSLIQGLLDGQYKMLSATHLNTIFTMRTTTVCRPKP